jgi:hypothetical protein
MTEIGYATLGIIPSFDGFERKLQSGTSSGMTQAGAVGGTKFGDAAGKSAGSRFGSLFKSAAKASLIGLAGAGALAFKLGKDSVSAASDLEESTNKVAQVFGKNADSIFKFTETTADKLGQSNVAARDAAATFGIFGKAAELSDRKNAKFATRMTRLASDLASFHNTEPEEAVQALGSALRGEAEPMRAYGVLLDEAALKAEALRLGLLEPVKDQSKIKSYQIAVIEKQRDLNEALKEHGESSFEAEKASASLGAARELLQKATEGTIPPLTQQQKVLAASSAIFKQTEVAQGDFARTSDGLANQQRRLSARFEDAKAELGQGLLPIMTDAADFLLDKGLPAFEDFSEWFKADGIPKLRAFGGFLQDDVIPPLKTAAGFAEDFAGYLADLPTEVKIGGLGTVAALIGGAKLRGGRGGLLGSAGGALGMTRPIPVLVTNPGFGGVAGGAGGKAGTATAAGAAAAAGGRKGFTITKGAVAITAAYFAADAITKILGWKEKTPEQQKTERQKEKEFGAPDYERKQEVRRLLGEMLNVSLGSGFGGLMQNNEGFAKALIEQDATRLANIDRILREKTGESIRSTFGNWAGFDIPKETLDLIDSQIKKGRELKDEFASFPQGLKVDVALNGVDRSLADARSLAREYDLTAGERKTLFTVLGVDRNKATMKTYTEVLGSAAKPVKTPITLTGVDRAHKQIDGIAAALDGLATGVTTGLDKAADTVLDAAGIDRRDRNRVRRRNLGGYN